MNLAASIFALITGYFLFKAPRQWAVLPLLIGASYMTLGQSIEIGPFHFTVIRMLLAIGVYRTMAKRERMIGGWNSLDRMMVWFAVWGVCSSFFHKDPVSTLVNHLGLAYDTLGIYFLLRIFICDAASIITLSRCIIILLIPIAIAMILECISGRDSFSFFGGVPIDSEVRGGKVRAQGPFGHSILAGTVGAVCLPLVLLYWKKDRKLTLLGLMAVVSIILCSRSSTPIMTAAFGLLGLMLWKVRKHMRLIRWGVLIAILLLNITMNAPVYYLLTRIDLTGSSTSWHRAALIEAAITHFDEWWLAGTDYTRHWMPYGVSWSKDHADITNHYIKMGVVGGLPLMLLFIGILVVGFSTVGKALRRSRKSPPEQQFLIWTLGSLLFCHAATMISVSYFDQSVVFLYLSLASIGSIYSSSSIGASVKPKMAGFDSETTSEMAAIHV